MSNGTYPIANVEIENGVIEFQDVWGDFAPDPRHGIELVLRFTEHSESAGNIHATPVEREVSVYLTNDQLAKLTDELRAYDARRELEKLSA